MRAVTNAPAALDRLRTLALATALACAASGAYASKASVIVSGWSFSADVAPDVTAFIIAPNDIRSQLWNLLATPGIGLPAANAGIVFDWEPLDKTAETPPHAKATVASSLVPEPSTQLDTPTFNLTAEATPFWAGLVNSAQGNMTTSGGFCLSDGFSDPTVSTSCNVAGSLTITVFYELLAELGPGGTEASAAISFFGSDGAAFSDVAFKLLDGTSSPPPDPSTLPLFFTWTVDLLGLGDVASFDLVGDVSAQAVPEPGVLSLAALGLLGLAATRRRRGALRSAA